MWQKNKINWINNMIKIILLCKNGYHWFFILYPIMNRAKYQIKYTLLILGLKLDGSLLKVIAIIYLWLNEFMIPKTYSYHL